MASKAKKSAPVKAPRKPARAASAKKSAKVASKPKLSVEDRVAALEAWALQSGAHLPHAYADEEAEAAK
jgi:hypothetical protein